MKTTRIGTFLFTGALAIGGAGTLHAATLTLEGTVSDAMCGAKHPVADAAGCTKDCVKKGSKGSDYALVVGDKVYTLKTSRDADKTQLDRLAGKMAKVTGDVTGENVIVRSVTTGAAKK